MPNKRKEGKKQITLWVDGDLYYSAFRAAEPDMTISEFTREAIKEKLKKEPKQESVAHTK